MVLADRLMWSLSSVIVWFLHLSFVSQIGQFEVRLLLVKMSQSVRSLFVSFMFVMDKLFYIKM